MSSIFEEVDKFQKTHNNLKAKLELAEKLFYNEITEKEYKQKLKDIE